MSIPSKPTVAHPGPVAQDDDPDKANYVSRAVWNAERPRALVICCSDGRLQESTDEFLENHLGIVDYDRLYAPGGPGALSNVACEFIRASQYRNELQFLLRAHDFNQIIMIFHGAGADGPAHSACAHYLRLHPSYSTDQFNKRHVADMADVDRYIRDIAPTMRISVFRAEVRADRRVRFVDLSPAPPAESADATPAPMLETLP
jgi:hypothetical protein